MCQYLVECRIGQFYIFSASASNLCVRKVVDYDDSLQQTFSTCSYATNDYPIYIIHTKLIRILSHVVTNGI